MRYLKDNLTLQRRVNQSSEFMKITLIFICILTFASCIVKPTTHTGNADTTKLDTIEIGNAFELNGLICQWEKVVTENEVILKLKNSQTNEILWEDNDLNYYENDLEENEILINFFDNLIDFNFDGFKDFSVYSRGSMPMTSGTGIYLFNKHLTRFEYSEELSNTRIEELDSINKTLTTFSWGIGHTETKVHYFDEFGKVIFTEIQTEEIEMNDTIETPQNTFKAIKRTEFEYFKNDYFPFDFKNYSTKKLLGYFYNSVTVDSVIYLEDKVMATDAYKIYRYKLEDSYISFFVKEGSDYFYIESAYISKNLFKSKNGVGIGISIDNFNKILKNDLKAYDHFTIEEGSGMVYKFYFKDGLLESIYIDNEI